MRQDVQWVVAGAVILLCLLGLYVTAPDVRHGRVLDETGTLNVSVPFHDEFPEGEYRISATIVDHPWSQRHVRVIADDCAQLTINGQTLERTCNFINGASLDLSPYLRPGENEVQAVVTNTGGAASFDLQPSLLDFRYATLLALLIASGAYLLFLAGLKLRYVLLTAGGAVVRVLYLHVTPYYWRQYDVYGHIEYITMLADGRMPGLSHGWQTYQPPLYHALAAIPYKLLTVLGVTHERALFLLQAQNVVYSLLFVVVCILAIDLLSRHLPAKRRHTVAFLLAAVIVFWPGEIFHSVRIGNDMLLALLYATGIYFVLRWWYAGDDRDLWLATAAGFLATMTKAQGALVLLIIVAAVLLRQRVRVDRRIIITAGAFLLATLIIIGPQAIAKLQGADNPLIVWNNNGLDKAYFIDKGADKFVYFDLEEFVTKPYLTWSVSEPNRDYFWNALFKSSLFSGVPLDNGRTVTGQAAIIISAAFLVLLAVTIWGLLALKPREHPILLLNLVLLIVAQIVMTLYLPCGCNRDFRYITPILISGAFAFGYVVSTTRSERLRALGYAAAIAFCALSVLAYLSFSLRVIIS